MGVFTRNMLSKIESAEGEEKRRLEDALILGLKAFSKEVNFLED